MKKKFIAYVLILCTTLLTFGGCAGGSEKKTKIVTDCSGTEVEIPTNIERVICVNQSFCAFMTAMGIQDKLIGTHGSVLGHSWAPIFYDGYSSMKRYGYEPAAEAIYEAKADLVVVNSDLYAQELRAVGIAAIYFNYTNIDELFYAVDLMGDIFGEEAKAYGARWKEKFHETVDKIAAEVAGIPDSERRKVYYINAAIGGISEDGLYNTFGGGSFVEYWINTIGANLVTSPYENVTAMNPEAVLALDFDTIILSGYIEHQYKDMLMSDPLWVDTKAVKSGRVYTMPTSLVSYERFAVELPMLFDYSASIVYPDYHSFDGIATLREFYKEFYGREFTDEQLENMLAGLNPDGTRME